MPQGYVGGTAAQEGEARKQCFGFKLFLDDPVSVVNKKRGRRSHEGAAALLGAKRGQRYTISVAKILKKSNCRQKRGDPSFSF